MGKSVTASPLSCVDLSHKMAEAKQDLSEWLEGYPRPQTRDQDPMFNSAKRCLTTRGVELTFIQSKGQVHEITDKWHLDFFRGSLTWARTCAAPDALGRPVPGCQLVKNHEARSFLPERDLPYLMKTFRQDWPEKWSVTGETMAGKGLLFLVGLIKDFFSSPRESLTAQPVLARNHQQGDIDGPQ